MLGKPQEKFFFSGRATKRGGGLNVCATKEKRRFFYVRKKVPMGGAKGLCSRATKKITFFCGFPFLLNAVHSISLMVLPLKEDFFLLILNMLHLTSGNKVVYDKCL